MMRLLVFLLFYTGCVLALPGQSTNVTFRSKMTFTNQTLANVWGYTAGGQEYALVGAKDGMIVVNVSNPDNPVQIVQIPGPSSSWREIRTYSHYAYVVSEGGGGVQVVDLTNLPGTNLSYTNYYGNGSIAGQLFSVHALHVDETKGFLYLYGSNLFSGKPLALNLSPNPYSPLYAGYFNGIGYGHDGYVDNDIMYSAHIFTGQFAIVNMANKSNPVLLASQATPGAFTHNTWLSGSTLFTTDEVSNSFLTAYSVANPANITLLDKIQVTPGSGSVVHNTHVVNDYAVTSWYKDGVAIIDVSRPANMVAVGRYDTYTNGAGAGFEGCWGVYPYFPSGTIVASNIRVFGTNNGELYVLTPTYLRGCYVEGAVTDATTGFPVVGAKVELLSTTTSENTGSVGTYKMGQWQSGMYTARVSKAGYVTQNIPVTLSNGVVTVLNAALQLLSLPVELSRFEAHAENRDALLAWETATEKNNAGFDIEHSDDDGRTWQKLGFVPARGDGSSATVYEYRAADLSPGAHLFRLRQVDTDGAFTFSPWRTVAIAAPALDIVVSPNPVTTENCLVRVRVAQAGRVTCTVWDAARRWVDGPWEFYIKDELEWPLSLAHWAPGSYYLTVQAGTETQTHQIIKTE